MVIVGRAAEARATRRHADGGFISQMVLKPRRGLLDAGITVGDLLLLLAAVPVLFGWVWLFAILFSPVPIG